jgi:hypothetical protein
MQSSLLDPVFSAVSAAAQANFAAYTADWVAKQQAVHDLLDALSVWPSEYFNYNAFAGEMYHVEQHFGGTAAVNAGGDLVIKYTGMGCTGVILRSIASTVFNIVIP